MQTSGVSRTLEVVAEFSDAWPSGIAVSRSGRIFVSFPRVESPPARITLGEWHDGKLVPFPDELTNDVAAGDVTQRFTSIHGIGMAPANRLFAIDTGATTLGGCDPNAAALYLIDLDHNSIARRYAFSRDVVDETTYLNDVVIDYNRGPNGTAYITDSGPKGPNGIIVIDLESGRAMRRLGGHPSVKGRSSRDGFGIAAEGEPLVSDAPAGADGIALSPDGATLWWTPLVSHDIWTIATDILADTTKNDQEVARAVTAGPDRDFASDGLDTDREGRVYFTDITNNAIQRYVPAQNRFETIAKDDRLVWPDAVALGPDRILYVTSSQLNRAPNYHDGDDRRVRPFQLFRMANDADPAQY